MNSTRRGLSSAIALLTLAGLPANGADRAAATQEHAYWFHEVRSPSVLSSDEGEALCRWIRRAIRKGKPSRAFPDLTNDRNGPSVVVISWSDGTSRATVRIGAGKSIGEAVKNATERHLGGKGPPRNAMPTVRLDIVQDIWQHPGFEIRKSEVPAPGLCGIAFSPQSDLAFLPGELIAVDAVGPKRRLEPGRLEVLLARRNQWRKLGRWNIIENYEAPQPACFFECQSFFMDDAGVASVFRGHRVMRPLTRSELRRRTDAGADFLVRTLEREPRDLRLADILEAETMTAEEKANRAPLEAEDRAGCALALLEFAEFANDSSAKQQARSQLRHLRNAAVNLPSRSPDTQAACIARGREVRLGTNALTILALLADEEAEESRECALRMGRWLADQLRPDGTFVLRRRATDAQTAPADSLTESSQATLALVRLYEATALPDYRTAAMRALQALVREHTTNREMGDLPLSPWLVEALNAGFTYGRDEAFAKTVERIALATVAYQTLKPPVPDELGGHAGSPSATRAATQVHLLANAMDLLDDTYRRKAAIDLARALHGYLMFQLQAQLDTVSTFFLKDPPAVRGAFRDDAVVVRFRPTDQWVQLRALVAAQAEIEALGADLQTHPCLPLTERQKEALRKAYQDMTRFPRALPE